LPPGLLDFADAQLERKGLGDGGGGAIDVVTYQFEFNAVHELNSVMWYWGTQHPQTLFGIYLSVDEAWYLIQPDGSLVDAVAAAMGDGAQVIGIIGSFLTAGENGHSGIMFLPDEVGDQSIMVHDEPPFGLPEVTAVEKGPRDLATGECSLVVEWKNETPPKWYSAVFLRDQIEGGVSPLRQDLPGELTMHTFPPPAIVDDCVSLVAWRTRTDGSYAMFLENCLEEPISCEDLPCDGPTVLSVVQGVREVGDGKTAFVRWTSGEEATYDSVEVLVNGASVGTYPGDQYEIALEGIGPGEHEVHIVADCGAEGGVASPTRHRFLMRAEPSTGMPPENLACKFVYAQEYEDLTVTFRRNPEAWYHEVRVLDRDGNVRFTDDVLSVSSGVNFEGTKKGDTIAARSFYGMTGEVYVTDFVTCIPALPPGHTFLRGDCDGDGIFNLTDAIFGLNYLFLGGQEPPCASACNSDGNEVLNLTDAVYSLIHLFVGGDPPPGNFPDCDEVPPDEFDDCFRPTCVP
jgi:hypothetical protein